MGITRMDVEEIQELLAQQNPRNLSEDHKGRAAVLMPIVPLGRELSFLLTKRSETVATHKGQVSFPGGYYEAGDSSLEQTALRETHEELGIPPESIRVLGRFHEYMSVTQALVRPYVGVLAPDSRLEPNPAEVAFAFQVPFTYFMETTPEVSPWERQGRIIPLYHWHFEGSLIWGLTAAMIKDLLKVLGLWRH